MSDNVWTGDAQALPQIEKLTISNAIIGREFTVEIGNKVASYTLIQLDVDEATGTQSLNSVAMRGVYAAMVALQTLQVAEFEALTFELVTDEGNDDEVTWILATGAATGRPYTMTLTASGTGVDVNVTVTQNGSAGQNEIQVVTIGTPTGGTFTLSLSGATTAAIAYNASAYTVRDALCDITGILGTDEVQVLTSTATGGTFDLTFEGQTAATIAFDVTAANLKTALEALSNVAVDDVTCTGGPLNVAPISITFRQALGRANRTEMTVDNTSATGGTVVPSTSTPGVASDVTVTGSAGGPWTVTFVSALAGTNVNTLTINPASLTGASGVSEVAFLYMKGIGGRNSFTLQGETTVSAGTFTITLVVGGTSYTTAAIAYNATVRDVQLAINAALTDITVVNKSGGNTSDDVMNSDSTYVEFWVIGSAIAIGGVAGFLSSVSLTSSLTGGTYVATLTFTASDPYSGGSEYTLRVGPGGTSTSTLGDWDSAATVQAALEALPEIGTGNVSVTQFGSGIGLIDGLEVTFIGDLAAIAIDDLELTQTTNVHGVILEVATQVAGEDAQVSPSISTTQNGIAARNEIQVVSFAETVASGTFTLTYSGQTTGAIAYDASAATVDAALEALSNIGAGDVAVTGSAGGPWTVEFQTALASTNVATMTGTGTSLVSASPSAFTETTTQNASSPNHFYHADNWSLGLPVDDQDLHWRDSDVPCLFDLEYASITPNSLHFWASYTGTIGLPNHNGDYQEYLPTRLKLGTDGDGGASTIAIYVGEGEGTGSTSIRLNTTSKQTTLIVNHTSTSEDGVTPVVDWIGTHVSNRVEVYRGSFGSAFYPGEASVISTLYESHRGNIDTDATIRLGKGCTVSTIDKNGGSLIMDTASGGSVTSFTNTAGDAEITGAGDVRKVIIRGGTVVSSTSGKLGQWGAITGATAANPCVITATAHGLTTGDKIRIGSVVGMTELNQNEYYVVVVNANSFQLAGINSTAYTAYSSGGYWGKCGSIEVAGESVLEFGHSMVDRFVAAEIDVYGSEAEIHNPLKDVTSLAFLTGEFAIRYHNAGPTEGLPTDGLVVFR